jgi:unsaturated rhamnogalacturonyl hydrolase
MNVVRRLINTCLQPVVQFLNPALALLLCAGHAHAASATTLATPTNSFAGATPLQWSIRMANSEMARRGDSLAYKPGGKAKWDYTAGLFTLSLVKLYGETHDDRYLKFAEQAIGSFITTDGTIETYLLDEYNIDSINAGKTVLALYQITKVEKYRKAAELLRKQLDSHPRTSEGGFWHKQRYPSQMWLDGIYMGSPFYAQYGRMFDDRAAFDDVAKQINLVTKHTHDPQTGLLYHGWDEKKQQGWANKETGTSSNFWARAIGWYAMALVDVLDFIPPGHPSRKDLISTLKNTSSALRKFQDRKTGLWYQVMDQGKREGNYLEATASSMFVYALAKGVNRSYLSPHSEKSAIDGYAGLINRLIKTNDNGQISLTQCCSVAGLGPMSGRERDGSFRYYVSEPIVENDLKGVGPFILAGIEMQQLVGLATNSTKASSPVSRDASPTNWVEMTNILARIKAPVFPNREFLITKFGAAAGGEKDCTEAIRDAITEAHKAGGGRVIVPEGEFLTGPIHLRSNVELHLAKGSTLKFRTNTTAYLPAVLTRFEGMECWNYSPLIYAFEQENIAVTGEGTLDGQAGNDNWWQWKGKIKVTPGQPNQKKARERLVKMVDQNTSPNQRRFGEGDYLRPSFIEPHRCRNVLIEGVRIRNSPMWELHPLLSTNVIVRGVEIISHGPNNDGCDPESSRDVLIEKCIFETGDDCIAIKSGRNNDGRRVAVPSENIIVRDCTMRDGHGGVVIGSEISGGCRNVFAENCSMDSTNLDRVLRFKSNAVRGGVVENVFVRNCRVGSVADAVLQIDFVYEEGANGPHKPVVRNVVINNVAVAHTPRVLNVVGFPAAEISNVRLVNCDFKQIKKPDVITEADVKLVDCELEPGK